MIDSQIYSKIFLLNSAELKQELATFLDYLLVRQYAQNQKKPLKKVPQFGCAKGKFHISEDFNAPIDHFDEYMPT